MGKKAGARPYLSVVFGTYNRLWVLKEAVRRARSSAKPFQLEFVIADGGSTDGTREWLQEQPDVVLLENSLEGACQALNACCRVARGRFVAHLNDDALCVGECLYRACQYLEMHREVGQAALAWRDRGAPDQRWHTGIILDRYYANFGVTRRWLGERVGWFGDGYLTYSCDQELSFRIWETGYQVAFLGGCQVEHLRVQDELRKRWAHDHGKPTRFLTRWRKRVGSFPDKPRIFEAS